MIKKQNIAVFGGTALLVGGGLWFALSRPGNAGSGQDRESSGTGRGGVSALLPSSQVEVPERFREAVSEMEEKWRKNRRGSTRSSYPPRDREDRGLFTSAGLSDVFEDTVGIPMPDYVTPLAGKYGVWQYTLGDTDNFNVTVYAYYAVEPEDVERLREDVLASWRKRFADQPVEVCENRLKTETAHSGPPFPAGSANLFVYEKDRESRMRKHSYCIRINRDNGFVYLSNFRGREE